jgi:hypothetical protein
MCRGTSLKLRTPTRYFLVLDVCQVKEHADGSSNTDDWFGPTSDIVNKVYPDVRVRDEGTIFLFTPITPRAKEWIYANIQPNAQ